MQSRIDQTATSRHVILSNTRGVVTELKTLQTDDHTIRYHKSSAAAGVVLEIGSWIGSRYHDAHWSFVKH